MELEFLKKLVDRYTPISGPDLLKVVQDIDLNNPAVLVGLGLIAASFIGLGVYVLLSGLSLLLGKKSQVEDRSLYKLNLRVNSLEVALTESKTLIKHLSQQLAADKSRHRIDMENLRAVINSPESQEKHVHSYRKAA